MTDTATYERLQKDVKAVKSDHHSTMRMSVRRGPNRSPSQPLGTSKSA